MMIPKPLLIVIEDVGWWKGYDLSRGNEPYRTGLSRMHGLSDYHAIVKLARHLNTQVLCGFVVGEWDKDGLLRGLPSATWNGDQWTGCGIDPSLLYQAAQYLKAHNEDLCLAVHGLGHEYWDHGISSRSEFHDENGMMRPASQVKKHLRMFGKLLQSSGIQNSFPHIFIPPALKHSFGNHEAGMQHILAGFGVRYVLTVFGKARQYAAPGSGYVTEECGVTLIERGLSPLGWNKVAPEPRFSFDQPILPLHWANVLHADPGQNSTVVDAWIDFLHQGAEKHGCLLFPEVGQALTQIVYYHLTGIEPTAGGVVLDISRVKRMMAGKVMGSCFLDLPASAKIHPGDGRLEAAGHIREGLSSLTPSDKKDHIRIYF